MGMFDYIRVEGHELPGLDSGLFRERQDDNESLGEGPAIFQTKDLENYLGTYVISNGKLFERTYKREKVPEKERPHYGKPEWDEGGKVFGKDYYRQRGSTKTVGHEDLDLDYHGDVRFYAAKKDLGQAKDWGSDPVEFVTRFTYGDLEWIHPVK